jgi:hypothetical protein
VFDIDIPGASVLFNLSTNQITIQFPSTDNEVSSGWELVRTLPVASSPQTLLFSTWTGEWTPIILNDDDWDRIGNMNGAEDFEYKLYAKFVTDPSEVLVACREIADGVVVANTIRDWTFNAAMTGITLRFSNGTSQPVELRFVYEPL